MSEYFSKEIEELQRCYGNVPLIMEAAEVMKEFVAKVDAYYKGSADAEDIASVVRCKDCKWTKTDETEDPAIYCKKWDRWEMPPDGFCWLGRKREES